MQELKDITVSMPVASLPPSLIKELQNYLLIGKYLNAVDGIFGEKTQAAYIQFKKDMWLGEVDNIGPTTIKALLTLTEKRQGTKEASQVALAPLSVETLGTRTGRSMALPDGRVVFANEFILPNIPLTWGETTAGCTRVPTQNHEVANALLLTKAFGEVREKFGSSIIITSGFRPSAVNRSVGGVSNSQHIPFKALDIRPANGDFPKLWEVLKASEFGGLGDGVSRGRGFYHVDIRNYRIIFGY